MAQMAEITGIRYLGISIPNSFRAMGNLSKERKGPSKTVRTPKMVERVRISIQTGDPNWPAYSPDLSLSDYFLCAYLKSMVYKDRSKTLDDLRNHIQAQIDNIVVDMLEMVTQSFQSGLH
ncbi:uncharacterized protein TNCV_2052991 [Trichonephila clavipes]|nr:uncharacterized protein TNCV_2052991 [Trichonephila clavipes]